MSDHDLNTDSLNVDLSASPDTPPVEAFPPSDVLADHDLGMVADHAEALYSPASADRDAQDLIAEGSAENQQEHQTHAVHSQELPPPDATQGMSNEAETPFTAIDSRIDALTRKIEQYPNAPVNYVLRGEVYFDLGDDALAADDFKRAVSLGEQHAETLDWGYVNAAFIDRAIDGLRRLTNNR